MTSTAQPPSIDFDSIRPGDSVTIKTPHGNERRGKVVMKFPTHCVLNGGGRHGTPLVASPRNIVRHRRAPQKRS
jgi:hypothetical protein